MGYISKLRLISINIKEKKTFQKFKKLVTFSYNLLDIFVDYRSPMHVVLISQSPIPLIDTLEQLHQIQSELNRCKLRRESGPLSASLSKVLTTNCK